MQALPIHKKLSSDVNPTVFLTRKMPPDISDCVSLLEDVNKKFSDLVVNGAPNSSNQRNTTGNVKDSYSHLRWDRVTLPEKTEISSKQKSSEIQEEVLKSPESGPYSYRPLNTSTNEFRVLCLRASSELTTPLECSILRYSLDLDIASFNGTLHDKAARRAWLAFSTYRPLSYTWENAEDKVPIEIQKLEVTRNLTVALRYMRQY